MATSSPRRIRRLDLHDDLPAEAQRVPRSTLLHTILFKRLSCPLTSRQDELWVIEVDQSGQETWSSLEDFLRQFCPQLDPHALQPWATSWREHYDIPAPVSPTSPELQYPVLPQPDHARARAGRPASWIPDHSHILRACWGRSARRFSQGDPSPSLLQPIGYTQTPWGAPTSTPSQPESEPHSSHLLRPSLMTTSMTSSPVQERNQTDDPL